MDNPGYQHDDPGAALQQRPLPGTPGTPDAMGSDGDQPPRPSPLQCAQPLHQPLYHALSQERRGQQQAQGQTPVTRRSRSLRGPPRRLPPPAGHPAGHPTGHPTNEDPGNPCTLNNSRVSLASWSPGPPSGARSTTSSPAASLHTLPMGTPISPAMGSPMTMSPSPAVLLNNHQNALKVRRNFISSEYQYQPPMGHHHPWPHKLHPLRNALGAYPGPGVPLLQVCNNQLSQLGQLGQLGPVEDGMTTKKPCRCPPEDPVHEYSSIIGPPPHPHKAASLSTEPLYWSPILKRAAGAGGGVTVPGGGVGGNPPLQRPSGAPGKGPVDEGKLKMGWCGTSRVFKYIVQRRGRGGRPRRGWRWLLWLLGAGALTLLMAIGLAAYLTAGFGLLRSTEAALRSNGMVTLAGEFRVLSERWTPSLKDQRSAAWRALSERIEMQLDTLFESSALASHYRHSTVTSLRPSPGPSEDSVQDAIDVGCDVVLGDAAMLPDLVERAGLAFLHGLRHRAGVVWLGDLAVDVQSIGFVGAPITPDAAMPAQPAQPAPTAADPSVPGWAPWSAWSECYWTESGGRVGEGRTGAGEGRGGSDMVRLRSRACALDGGRGRPLDGPEPCLLRLPSAGSHFEMEPCTQSQPAPGSPTAATILIQDTVVALTPAKLPAPPAAANATTLSTTATPVPTPQPPAASPSSSPASSAPPSTVILPTSPVASTKVSMSSSMSSSTEPNPSPFSMTTLLVPVIVTERPTTTSTTTEISRREPRHCDECLPGEVCVARSDEPVPRCQPVRDPQDPTGCGGHCKLNFEFCQRLDVDAFRCVDDSVCLPGEWRCGNQLCIPLIKRCDGHFNCYDHTDEHNCECNLQTHFQCGNKTSCLPKHKLCDGVVDCWNAADELNCTRSTVMLTACPRQDQFSCSNGQCIPHSRFCDGFSDCGDKSDEPFGCEGDCRNHEWKCGNNRCIRKRAVCNGVDDCGDQSDERECRKSRLPGN